MSDFKTKGSSPEVQAILGKCRSKGHALRKAQSHRAAGSEAKAQVLEHRAKTGKVGVEARRKLAKARAAERATKTQAREGRKAEETPGVAVAKARAQAPGRGTKERQAQSAAARQARKLGVPRQVVREGLAAAKGTTVRQRRAAEGPNPAPSAHKGLSHAERITHAFEEVDAANKGTNFVKIHDLRQKLPDLGRAEFDAAVGQMRRGRHLALTPHEGLHGRLAPEEKSSGIREREQNFVYAERGDRYKPPPAAGASPGVAVAKARAKAKESPAQQAAAEPRAGATVAPADHHEQVKAGLKKVFGADGADDRRINIEQLARQAGISHEASADYVHGLVRKKIAEYDYMSESDAAHNAQFAKVHRDPDTGKAIAGFRIFKPDRLGEMARARETPAGTRVPDLGTFAGRVREIAAGVPKEGRLGNKAMIGHVHGAYEKAHGPVPIDEFKHLLESAAHARHLDLARADLSFAHDPGHIHRSEIRTGHAMAPGATFHFVRF